MELTLDRVCEVSIVVIVKSRVTVNENKRITFTIDAKIRKCIVVDHKLIVGYFST